MLSDMLTLLMHSTVLGMDKVQCVGFKASGENARINCKKKLLYFHHSISATLQTTVRNPAVLSLPEQRLQGPLCVGCK